MPAAAPPPLPRRSGPGSPSTDAIGADPFDERFDDVFGDGLARPTARPRDGRSWRDRGGATGRRSRRDRSTGGVPRRLEGRRPARPDHHDRHDGHDLPDSVSWRERVGTLDSVRPSAGVIAASLVVVVAVVGVVVVTGMWRRAAGARLAAGTSATLATLPLTTGASPIGSESDAPAPSPAAGLVVITTAPPPTTTIPIRVHVAGAVARPGVYVLSSSARVVDAAEAAGGATAELDVDAVNLAAPVADGERVFLPRRGHPVPSIAPRAGAGIAAATAGVSSASTGSGGGTPGGGSSSGGPVSLSTATVDELDGLPGIGPALAQRIVEYRTAHGGFRSVEQLLDVPGIGDAKLASLRSKVRV